ncbi:MAG: MFS transporter [Gloeomargarita sp. SKYBB_i_bin120]|nr:MFS transporter [Gloeomargarita sp. SKYG98]MCS7291963.1 MFS transporter [Gloeomargarita sp. SKYB120]MDW8177523.1 MFS transporter [Gloeomargarita sp. SKYBB_i_bin120]
MNALPSQPGPAGSSLWRSGNFLLLWLAQVFSQVGDKVYLVLMTTLLDQQLGDQAQITPWVSGIMVAFTIPAVLFGSVAGVLVDRWRKQQVLLWTNGLRGALVLLLVPVLGLGWSPWRTWLFLLAVTFAVSTLTQFFAPAEQAAIPLLVPKEQLLSANSLYTTTMMGSLVVGFALGDPLLRWASHWLPQGPELLVAGAYWSAALLLVGLRAPERVLTVTHTFAQVWQDLREGWAMLQARPLLGKAVARLVVLYSVFAALAVLTIQLAEQLLRPSQFGFLLAAAGVGVALGALMLHLWPGLGQWPGGGSLVMGGAFIGLALTTHSLVGAFLWHGLLGFGAALATIPLQTLLQTETPEAMRGKVFGLQNNAVNIALSLPLAVTGVLATSVGLPTVFLGLAGVMFLVVSW